MSAFHSSKKGASNHTTASIFYANAADRGNDTRAAGSYLAAFVAGVDEGRIAFQQDTERHYILDSIAPDVWSGPLGQAGGGGEANTLSGSGVGVELAAVPSKVDVDLRTKDLIAGTNISLTNASDSVTINAAPSDITDVTATAPLSVSSPTADTRDISTPDEIDLGTQAAAAAADFSNTNTYALTLSGDATITVSNLRSGQTGSILIQQDGTGNHTPTWAGSTFQWIGGNAPPSTGANTAYWVSLRVARGIIWGQYTGIFS